MDDRTRSTEARLHIEQLNSDPGIGGLVLGAVLAVMLGSLMVAGLATAIGAWPAAGLATLAFAGLVWFLVPTAEMSPAPRAGSRSGAPRSSFRLVRRGLTIACLGGVCGIVMSIVPGCSDSPAKINAYQALDTNDDILTPFTLRGIDDAESQWPAEGSISPALAEQYRGLAGDNSELIDALNGRPAEGAGVVVGPQRQNRNNTP